ncbi:hypothetical protein TNCT_411221 [Trichonephila clavata]|uniref:DUF5641 domain-containing protein n=1 Tax=Trichonephila clavata TaxID=2740835 RepID=A0A8X6HM73_TRICU|nr:hypothetical protein TNCT_411221 [Trichonephila clavata]
MPNGVPESKLGSESTYSFEVPQHQALGLAYGAHSRSFPGNDGLVRVVEVKTSSGILRQAINKVVSLPISDDLAAIEQN